MAPKTLGPQAMQNAIRDALGAHWRLFLIQGVVMIILGVIAVAAPAAATFAIDLYVGWLFLLSGLVGLIAMFSAGNLPAFLWTLVTAALSLAVGALLISRPIQGALSLTIVLTAFFIAEGIFQIVASIAYRAAMRSWIWMSVSGFSDLLLAAIIILGWPMTAVWALGLLVGINLITSGWAIVMAGLAGRAVAHELETPAAAVHR
jgi:uncharacterized membrane protein HdeD (DUF308 family)